MTAPRKTRGTRGTATWLPQPRTYDTRNSVYAFSRIAVQYLCSPITAIFLLRRAASWAAAAAPRNTLVASALPVAVEFFSPALPRLSPRRSSPFPHLTRHSRTRPRTPLLLSFSFPSFIHTRAQTTHTHTRVRLLSPSLSHSPSLPPSFFFFLRQPPNRTYFPMRDFTSKRRPSFPGLHRSRPIERICT